MSEKDNSNDKAQSPAPGLPTGRRAMVKTLVWAAPAVVATAAVDARAAGATCAPGTPCGPGGCPPP